MENHSELLKYLPILGTVLQGFTDHRMNIRLLWENKGSIKQVVKDLVRIEKEGGRLGRDGGV
jgi:hypothetical protein